MHSTRRSARGGPVYNELVTYIVHVHWLGRCPTPATYITALSLRDGFHPIRDLIRPPLAIFPHHGKGCDLHRNFVPTHEWARPNQKVQPSVSGRCDS